MQFHPTESGDTGPSTEQLMSPLERDALPAGTLLGGCQIVEALYSDGRSIVYLASDGALQRQVLIKEHFPSQWVSRHGVTVSLLPGADADERSDALEVFLQEARLLARLDHPAIVRVHRFWEENRTAYMMMPFHQAQSLAATLQRLQGPAGETWLRGLLSPLLGALQLLHSQDCLHLGLSPDTILLQPDGRPLLIDLSTASSVVGDRRPVDADSLDRLYVPIEQFSHGAELPLGPCTDLYALAAVAHHAMLGYPPVSAAVLGTEDRLAGVADGLTARPGVAYSRSLVAAIDQALAVLPQDRPQSVTAFQRLLAIGPEASAPVPVAVSTLTPLPPELPPEFVAPAAGAPSVPVERRAAAAAGASSAPAPASAPQEPPEVSPLSQPLPGDPEAIDPAVSAAIARAISSLPWDTKVEPALSPKPVAGAAEPASIPGSPFAREAAGVSREEPAPGEILFAMKPSPRVPSAAAPAPRRSGRWVAAVLALAVVGVGAWAASTQPIVAEQWASWFGSGRSEGATSAVATTAAATAPPNASEVRAQSEAASSPTLLQADAAASSAGLASSNAAPAQVAAASQGGVPAVSPSVSAPLQAAATVAATPKEEAALPTGATAAGVQAERAAPATVTPLAPSASAPEASTPEVKPEVKLETKPERAVAKAAPTPPATPRAACAGKSNFSLEYCMQTQCKQARFSRHPQCRG
ncbi:MAG: hypothetical protein RLZZ618_3964 [Pseudomonadota bacterium]|jgi:serine/threonine protein kinase